MFVVTETHSRTVVKTVLYRILSIIGAMAVTLFFGASASTAGKFGLVVLIAGTIIYYLHDRVWLFFGWNRNNMGNDSIKRSLAKTVIYRLIVLVVGFITAKVLVTDDNGTAMTITLVIMLINLVFYYVLERVFNRIQWGKVAPSILA
jgi:uncharacterized membrane protein